MNKRGIALILFLFIIVGCNNPSGSTTEPNSEPNSEATSEFPSDSVVTPVSETFDFFALNDFHGAIQETADFPYSAGIFKISSYLKEKYDANPGATAFFNSGDMWQGTADSNLSKGELLTKMLNELDTEAMALGNHEFDWYDTAIMHNKEVADFPFLGANIIDKRTNAVADNLVAYDDTFKASHMFTKKGVNFGVVGTMGSSLESSILGLAIENYTFEKVTNHIIDEAANLRTLGADVIVLLTHDSLISSLGEYQKVVDEKHVDMIFTGHQHKVDNRLINGIPIMQTYGNGQQIMEVNFTYNFETKNVTINKHEIIGNSLIKGYPEDPAMLAVYAPYADEISAVKDEVIGSLDGDLTKDGLVNVANRAMYNYASQVEGLDNLVAVHNKGGVRAPAILFKGDVTYGEVYQIFPFDNEIMIIEDMLGSDLNTLIWGDYVSYQSGITRPFESDKLYNLATIDFISFREGAQTLKYEQRHTGKFVRDLIRDFFLEEGTINVSQYN